jgi:uncharacterized protein YacL
MIGIIVGLTSYMIILLRFNSHAIALISGIIVSSFIYYLMGYFDEDISSYKIKQQDGVYECIKCEKKNTSFAKSRRLNGTTDIYISCNNCIRGWKINE